MTGGNYRSVRSISLMLMLMLVLALGMALAFFRPAVAKEHAPVPPPDADARYMALADKAREMVRRAAIGRDERKPLPPALLRRFENSVGLLVSRRYNPRKRKWGSASCTASCVAPHIILTAAHCVMGIRGGRSLPAEGRVDLGSTVFILRPWDRARSIRLQLAGLGDAERRRLLRAGPGNVKFFDGNFANDWALLPLSPRTPCPAPLNVKPVPVDSPRITGRGRPLLNVAFQGDKLRRKDRRLYHSTCRATRDRKFLRSIRRLERRAGRRILLHHCDASKGASGSPIMLRQGKDRFAIIAIHTGVWGGRRQWRSRRTGKVVKRQWVGVETGAPAVNFHRALQELKRDLPGILASARRIDRIPLANPGDERTPLPENLRALQDAVGLLVVPLRDRHGTRRRKAYCNATCLAPDIVATPARCVLPMQGMSLRPDLEGMLMLVWSHREGRLELRFRAARGTGSPVLANGMGTMVPRTPREWQDWALLRLAPETPCRSYLEPLPIRPDAPRLVEPGAALLSVGHEKDWLKDRNTRLGMTRCRAQRLDEWRKMARRKGDRPLPIILDCHDRHRLHGGPILLRTPEGLRLIGIFVAHRRHLPFRKTKEGVREPAEKARLVQFGAPAINFMPAFGKFVRNARESRARTP